MWTVNDEMVLEIDPAMTDAEALALAARVSKEAVGEAALIDIFRMDATTMRVLIYVEEPDVARQQE